MRRPVHLLSIPVALVVAASCAEPSGDDASPATGSWTVSAEPLLSIGVTEGDAAYMFDRISGARLLEGGGVAVADAGLAAVRVYGADGSLEAEMGGRGQGPGEFEYVSGLGVAGGDTLVTWDSGLGRLTFHTADGELVTTTRAEAGARRPDAFYGRFDDGGVVIGWIEPSERPSDRALADDMRLARFGPDGGLEETLVEATGLVRLGRGPVPFSPFLHAVARGNRLWVTNGTVPEITVFDHEGNVVDTLRTPDAGVDPSRAWETLVAGLEERGDSASLERLEGVPRNDSIPHIADLLVDDEHRVWAKRYEPAVDALWLGGWVGGRGGEWWVIELDGSLAATVALPDGLVPLDVRGDRLLGLRTDDLGVQRLVLHGIER